MNTKNDPTLTVNLLAEQADDCAGLIERNARTLNDECITQHLTCATRRCLQRIRSELTPDNGSIRELKDVE